MLRQRWRDLKVVETTQDDPSFLPPGHKVVIEKRPLLGIPEETDYHAVLYWTRVSRFLKRKKDVPIMEERVGYLGSRSQRKDAVDLLHERFLLLRLS